MQHRDIERLIDAIGIRSIVQPIIDVDMGATDPASKATLEESLDVAYAAIEGSVRSVLGNHYIDVAVDEIYYPPLNCVSDGRMFMRFYGFDCPPKSLNELSVFYSLSEDFVQKNISSAESLLKRYYCVHQASLFYEALG
jgi:hypothetical protein